MARTRRNDRGGWYTARKSGRKFNYAEPWGEMVAGVDERSVTVHHGFIPVGQDSPFQTYTWSRAFRDRLARDLERLPLPGKRINPKLVVYQDGAVICTGWDYYQWSDDPEPTWWVERFGTAQQKAALLQEQEQE